MLSFYSVKFSSAACAALQLASQTCDAALKALSDLAYNPRSSEDSSENTILPKLLKDYASLLSLIYHSATKLALALKPTSPTFGAALTPLKDLTAHVDALASCACSVLPARDGRALMRELRWKAEEVVGAVQALLGVFVACADSPVAGETYLVKTGTVHETVDRARGVSRSNREAVRKRWEADIGGLDDCAKEVLEMIEDKEGDDDDDGGWTDLDSGLPPSESVKPTATEMTRLKMVSSLKSVGVMITRFSIHFLHFCYLRRTIFSNSRWLWRSVSRPQSLRRPRP